MASPSSTSIGLSNNVFSDASGAVSDLFAASADKSKAQGDFAEAQNYDLAEGLANQNAQYTQWTTGIQAMQAQRKTLQTAGTIQSDIGGSGLTASGSSLDLLRESAENGAVAKDVGIAQGNITQAGYEEQAQSYNIMSQAATAAGNAENTAATGADITAGIKGVAAVANIAMLMA